MLGVLLCDRLGLKQGWDFLGCGSHCRPGLFSTRVVSGDRMWGRMWISCLAAVGKKGVTCFKQCCALLTTVNIVLEFVICRARQI